MKKATVFLVLTFLLSWPPAFWAFGSGLRPYTGGGLLFAVYFMCTPMIAAIVTQKLIFHGSVLKPLGVCFRPNWWFLVALLFPGVLALGATAASLLFSGVSLTGEPGESTALLFFGQNLPPEQIEELVRSATELPLHPFFLILLGGTIAGLTVNGLAGFGEELGWRGLLLRESASLGFWLASFAIGLVWGLWHLPFIVHGHNYPGHPIAGVLVMMLWTVLFSPLIAYLCIRSQSVLAAAIMHGALNGTVMAPLIVLKGGDSLQIGVMGFAGILVLICFNIVLLVWGRPEEWHNKITGANAGGPRQLPVRMCWAARVAQFRR